MRHLSRAASVLVLRHRPRCVGSAWVAQEAEGAQLSYRSDIDGLRAVAVLSVVAFHAFPTWLRGGFIGVDIFYVISGFLISGIIFNGLEQKNFRFVHFYARRIRRIFPALTLVLLFSSAIGWFALLPDEFKQLGRHIAASAGFANNILLWKESGYFDTSVAFKPLLHLWSLGVEEQFYLTYPLLVWLAWKRSAVPVVLLGAAIISFALNVVFVHGHPTATFYLPLTRFWQLLAGGSLAYVNLYNKQSDALNRLIAASRIDWVSNSIGVIGLLLIAAAIAAVNSELAYPGWWALLPTVGAFLLIAVGEHSFINRAILSNPWLVFVGLISYPLYLWHWVLLSFTRIVEAGDPSRELIIWVVALSFLLAWLTYKLIEKPIRLGGNSIIKPVCLGVSLAIIGYAGFEIFQTGGFPSRFQKDYLARIQDVTSDTDAPFSYAKCPNGLSFSLPTLSLCILAKEKAATAVIWGDSHAEHFFPGVAKNDGDQNWLLVGNSACPPTKYIEVQAGTEECNLRSTNILDFLVRNKQIETVVLVFFGNYIAMDNYSADHLAGSIGPAKILMKAKGMEGHSKNEIFFFGLELSVEALEKAGKRIVIVVDIPELPFFPKKCVPRPFAGEPDNCVIPKLEVGNRQRNFRALLDQIVSLHPEVKLFDPLDIFCDGDMCSAIKDGVVLYNDLHHLSHRGSEIVGMKFLQFLSKFSSLMAQ